MDDGIHFDDAILDDEDDDADVGECWNCGAEYDEVWAGEPPAPPRKCLDCGEMESP